MMETKLVIPNLPELTFDDCSHIYRLNGNVIPSVTKIMEPLSSHEYREVDKWVLQKAANRGTAVHNAIENWIKFGIEDLDPDYRGYFDGFKNWWNTYKPEPIGSEVKTYHRILGYAGTVDLVAVIGGRIVLVDFKTTSKLIDKNCKVQLEAYAQALASHGIEVEEKRILHLTKDGGWKEPKYPAKDPEAWRVFGSLKCLYDYLGK